MFKALNCHKALSHDGHMNEMPSRSQRENLSPGIKTVNNLVNSVVSSYHQCDLAT